MSCGINISAAHVIAVTARNDNNALNIFILKPILKKTSSDNTPATINPPILKAKLSLTTTAGIIKQTPKTTAAAVNHTKLKRIRSKSRLNTPKSVSTMSRPNKIRPIENSIKKPLIRKSYCLNNNSFR